LKNVPGYLGSFAHDKLPKIENELSCGIINLNNQDEAGSHWCCFYNRPTDKVIHYFDSYGVVPSNRIEKQLKNTKKKILYNTSQIQDQKSVKCGWYCYFFIKKMAKKMKYYDFIYQFNTKNRKKNDEILVKAVEKLL